jgi:rhombotarget A family protien
VRSIIRNKENDKEKVMLKKSIGIGLLLVAGQTYSADITVTTTEDVSKDDDQCSLREAIEYINRGLDKKGYMGCGGENSTTNIILKSKETYNLSKHIAITKSLSIKSTDESDSEFSVLENVPGLKNAVIKMTGKDNIFRINSKDEVVLVNLNELDLTGCAANNCAEQGGLVYNKGLLIIKNTRLLNGFANLGGAIYNAGTYANNEISRIEVSNSLFEKNKANQGAILYSEIPYFSLEQNVFKENQTTAATSANIFSQPHAKPEDIPSITAEIFSSTFLKNQGSLVSIVDGIGVNNITAVDNAAQAIKFNAPEGLSYLTNSIILQNGAADCQFASNDDSILQNNLTSASCGVGDPLHPNQIWSSTQIFSGTGSEGVCQTLAQNNTAILCPYTVPEGSFLGYLRPRILMSYKAIEESPILNQGRAFSNENPSISCEAADQRGVNRLSDNVYCDRGSIEITVPTTTSLVGQDIRAGGAAKFNINQYLGDSDLIPKAECKALVGDHPDGEAWQDGCLKVVQTKTVSKGKTTLDILGNVVYTPNSVWHGADIFELQVITSSTRFNKNKPYLAITTQIVQAPENKMDDKSVKTSGGSWGMVGLFALFGLIGLRRLRQD